MHYQYSFQLSVQKNKQKTKIKQRYKRKLAGRNWRISSDPLLMTICECHLGILINSKELDILKPHKNMIILACNQQFDSLKGNSHLKEKLQHSHNV